MLSVRSGLAYNTMVRVFFNYIHIVTQIHVVNIQGVDMTVNLNCNWLRRGILFNYMHLLGYSIQFANIQCVELCLAEKGC